jgi:GntR family transcriptional regulator
VPRFFREGRVGERLSEAKARHVYLLLRDRIMSGVISFGAKLPNEVELASSHRVSRVTVRRALAELQREHLIERRRSTGTRVIYRPSPAPITADIAGVLANIAEMGRRTTVDLLSFEYVAANGPAAEALGTGKSDLLQRAVRVRSIDGLPFSHLTTHVPEQIGVTFDERDLAKRPLLELLERSGVKVDRATQRISAVLATPDVAKVLKVKAGSPLIALVRVVYDSNGRGVEHLQALYRPDRYNFEIDLVRSAGASAHSWFPVMRPVQESNEKTGSVVAN